MVKSQKDADQFTPDEAQKRFEAALRGARVTGHKPKANLRSDTAKKRGKAKKSRL